MNKLAVTEKGERIIAQSIQIFGEVEQKALQDFSPEEVLQFNDFVQRIRKNLEEIL